MWKHLNIHTFKQKYMTTEKSRAPCKWKIYVWFDYKTNLKYVCWEPGIEVCMLLFVKSSNNMHMKMGHFMYILLKNCTCSGVFENLLGCEPPACVDESVSSWRHVTLQRRHNEHDGVSNHQPHDCLLNHLFRPRSKKTSKLRVTSLCAENSPVTCEFPAQRASEAENVSIWWRHHQGLDQMKPKSLGHQFDQCITKVNRDL